MESNNKLFFFVFIFEFVLKTLTDLEEELTLAREEAETDPSFIWTKDIEQPLAKLKLEMYTVSQTWNLRILRLLGIQEEDMNDEGNYMGKKIVDML